MRADIFNRSKTPSINNLTLTVRLSLRVIVENGENEFGFYFHNTTAEHQFDCR